MTTARCSHDHHERYGFKLMKKKNENLSLYVMCFFLLASLAFLAQQISAYH
jgi:hypothetical protein